MIVFVVMAVGAGQGQAHQDKKEGDRAHPLQISCDFAGLQNCPVTVDTKAHEHFTPLQF